MFTLDNDAVFAAQILFFILLPLVLFGSLRWAVFAWLLMGNLDASNAGQSVSNVGLINAVKSIGLPLYLIWRMRQINGTVHRTPTAVLWMGLTAYAAIATVWGPFPLAGSKLVANMAGILIAVVVLEKAARLGLLTSRSLQILIWGSLALAILQTYYFGGATYGFDGFDQRSRLSSFVAAQQFAAFLVAFLTITLWFGEFGFGVRLLTGLAVLSALLLNGSRVWFLGALFVTLFYLLVVLRQRVILIGLGTGAVVTSILLFMSFNSNTEVVVDNSSNRILATMSAVATGSDTSNRVGLRDLTFRTAIYTGIMNDISSSGLREIAMGHGTSSGAIGVLRVFPNSYDEERLDPNRIVHNEWLRAAYEWGIVGLLLLAGVFSTMLAGLVSICRAGRRNTRALATLSFVPAFLLAFSSENVLASAGNAMTLSLAIMLGLLWMPVPELIRRTQDNHGRA